MKIRLIAHNLFQLNKDGFIEISARSTQAERDAVQHAMKLGIDYERERIIKLLETEYGEMSEPNGYILDNDNYPARLHKLIALIKGENK